MPNETGILDVEAVLFDLDGTLIDSAPVYYKIIEVAFQRLDFPLVSNQTLVEALKDGEFNWDLVLPSPVKFTREEMIRKARGIIDEISGPMFREAVTLVAGTGEVLRQIRRKGLKLGIVTSTPRNNLALKLTPLKEAGVDAFFESIITSDDVRNKKPHAEPLILCSQRLCVTPGKSAYVGDTRVDIRAGKAAGMKTIGVLTGFDTYDTLKNETPDAVIDSIARIAEAIPRIDGPDE